MAIVSYKFSIMQKKLNNKNKLVKLRKGQKVIDRWFKEWGIGVCVKVLKTRWHIDFTDGETRVFDKQHLQFLKVI